MPTAFYKCDKCKRTWDSEAEASACEKSHLAASAIREVEYRLGPYPFRVIITFSDGAEVEYVKVD